MQTIGLTFSENGWHSAVATVSAIEDLDYKTYNLYIFCANTYNWKPDAVISNYIKQHQNLKDKNTVAITLGSGSTKRAQRLLEKLISKKGANLIASKSFWLMKPNDDSNTEESNIILARQKAQQFAKQITTELEN